MQVARQSNSSAIIFSDSDMVQRRKLQKSQQSRMEHLEREVLEMKEKITLISKVLEHVRFN